MENPCACDGCPRNPLLTCLCAMCPHSAAPFRYDFGVDLQTVLDSPGDDAPLILGAGEVRYLFPWDVEDGA